MILFSTSYFKKKTNLKIEILNWSAFTFIIHAFEITREQIRLLVVQVFTVKGKDFGLFLLMHMLKKEISSDLCQKQIYSY